MADSYISITNTDALSVPVLAATIYAAEESSLFLGGSLIPVVNAPNGVLQVPELASVTASTISGGGITTDVAITNPADTKNTITCDLLAARSVVRDLGAVDPSEIGRVLGKAVATAFDQSVYTALDSATASTVDSFPLEVDDVYDGIQQIRDNGEMGDLYGVLNPQAAFELTKAITSAGINYAGGEFQTEALRNGFIGRLGGVTWFMSSNVTTANTSGYIFGADALRIAMQKNVSVEVARRAEAVGFDVVASLHAAAAMVDANRSVKLINV